MSDTVQQHIQLRSGDVGRYAFLPGDPGRCELIARRMDEPRHVATNREFTTWVGSLDGERIAVVSTGIGGPSAAIAVEELAKVGVDTFVRVGTAGSMQPWVVPGDVVVVQAAIRDEGTTRHYLPSAFPAVADWGLTNLLAGAAAAGGFRVHVGIAQSKDSFYGQHEPGRMPVADRLQRRWEAFRAGGALCSEMEAAAVFVVARVLGARAAALMQAGGHHDQTPMTDEEQARCDLQDLITAAVGGMREIVAADRAADVDHASMIGSRRPMAPGLS